MKSLALIVIWCCACDAAFTVPLYSPIFKQEIFRERSGFLCLRHLHTICTGRAASSFPLQPSTVAGSVSDPWTEFGSRTKYVDEDMIKRAIYEHGLNDRSVDGMQGTLVQKGINLHYWLYGSGLEEKYNYIHFYANFNGSIIDERTSADLYIVKAQDEPHQRVVFRIGFELGKYAESNGRYVDVGGGNLKLAQQVRRPDLTLFPYLDPTDEYPPMPRVLVEVEVRNRSGPEPDKWCREYFSLIPQLQAVLLIKVYPRRESGGFGALAVLYRRASPGSPNVNVDDAVSFGTEYLSSEALRDLPSSILAKPIRKLPDVPVKAGVRLIRSPWKPRDQPFILIKAQDIFHWKFVANQQTLVLPQHVADAAKDCKLELWRLMAVLNTTL